MTILQATMSDGTLVPVQADSQGRLVAEGLQGPQGPEGPQGPPGPQGPAFQLPPNPQPGDVLAWDNGLIWVSGLVPSITPKTDTIISVGLNGGETQLVFASNYGFDKFFPGDSVFQNSGYTPETSEIVGWNGVDTLTFADSTDLDNFRVGDLITLSGSDVPNTTGPWVGRIGGEISTATWNSSTHDTFTPDNTYELEAGPAPQDCLVFDTADFGPTYEITINKVGGFNAFRVWHSSTPDGTPTQAVASTNAVTLSSSGSQTPGIARRYVFISPTTGGSAGSTQPWRISGSAASIVNGTISSISTNTIVLSDFNGTWVANAGKHAIGPDTTPATGTIASLDSGTATINLSVSDETPPKRWIVNQARFLEGQALVL